MKTLRHSLLLPSLALAALLAPPARAAVAPSAAEAKPLAVGATTPGATLLNADGTAFDLGAALSEKPTVLIFYRGGWCPFCTLELGELAEFESQFTAHGYQIIAISTYAPAGLAPTADKHHLAYRLLSDRGMVAADAYPSLSASAIPSSRDTKPTRSNSRPAPSNPTSAGFPSPPPT